MVYRSFDTYTTEDHHAYVKDNFIVLNELISEKLSDLNQDNASILDIGCATGSLLSYLQANPKISSFHGIDISDDLLDIAKEKLPNITFSNHNILYPFEVSEKKKFDIISAIGVFGIFKPSDCETIIKNMFEILSDNGTIYIFSHFNDYRLDVNLEYKESSVADISKNYSTGWNIISKDTIASMLKAYSCNHRFIDFQISTDLLPKSNPVRSWTYRDTSGLLQLTNGLKLKINFSFLEITKL